MRNLLIAVLAVLLAAPPPSRADVFGSLRRNYEAAEVGPIHTADSPRLSALIRGGIIYLSLRDMIALAIENNIDVESQRYNPKIAEADLLRARAGGLLRGVNTNVSQGPDSASSSGALAGANSLGGGLTGSSTNQGAFSGITIQGLGTAIPTLDPVLSFNGSWGHTTQPLTSTNITGTTSLVTQATNANFIAQKGFLTGTVVTYGFYNTNFSQNSPANEINPATQSTFALNIRQNLLQGFGRAVNGRLITVAKNDRELTDLVFRQQVITTVTSAVNLYFDLVALRESQRVQQLALDISERLLADNKTRVSIGALAPIEIVRAEAEAASDQQEVIEAETLVLQQEIIIKDFLTRSDRDDSILIGAHVIPTDSLKAADALPVEPVQDLFAEALSARPEVKQNAISLTNTRESIRGTKNALLPTLSAFVDVQNNALSGSVNTTPVRQPDGTTFVRTPADVDQFFVGGYGRALGQLFGRNFPDYTVGMQFTIPLNNRQARADYVRDELILRQQQLADLKLRKQVKTDVQNGVIGIRQAKAAYDTAVKSRALAEQTLDGERKKFSYGAEGSSILNVILVQRDLSRALAIEVTALNSYSRAKTQFEQALGRTLDTYDVSIREAVQGRVDRAPDPVPVNTGVRP